jgi:hypothetical protein
MTILRLSSPASATAYFQRRRRGLAELHLDEEGVGLLTCTHFSDIFGKQIEPFL